jgi:transcriptional regulator with XRE-family HTH domain
MNIREIRESKGLTQIEVAMKVGCSLSSYRLWEVGVTTPTEENQKKLNEVLGVE